MPFSLNSALGTNLTATYTSTEYLAGESGAYLGQRVVGNDGNTYIFVLASGAIDAGAACLFNENGTAVMVTTTNAGSVPASIVVPQVAIADTKYGWAVEKGENFQVLALTACLLDVRVYTTATAGRIDDTATKLIQGLRLNATVGGATALTSATALSGMTVNTET